VTDGNTIKTTFGANVHLPEPTITQAGSVTISALWQELEQIAKSLVAGGQQTLDGIGSTLPIISTILGASASTAPYIVSLTAASIAVFWPYFEFVRGDISARAGLAKLSVPDAIEALKRGFISDTDASADIAFTGLDAQRIQALKDLSVALLDIDRAMDMYFKQIITQDDLRANLKDHGFTVEDQTALIDAALRKVDVDVATTALRWGVIGDEAWNAVLKQNLYTDNEIALAQATLYNHESAEDIIGRLRLQALYSGLGFSDPTLSSVPQEVIDASRREGQDAQISLDKWQRSYYVPSIEEWISLYFRGIRNRSELQAAFNYYKVPVQLQNDIIAVRQSLIPWRTIPTMLANGVISEPYAKQQLQAHGFDLTATEALLKYAQVAHSKSKAAFTGDPMQASLATAKELWTIGAFTDEQYEESLIAHGFTKEEALDIVASQKNAEIARERKQVAADITDEVLAGLLTIDQAKTQMAQHNFTLQETARVLKTISRTQRATSKTPTEAELTKFVKSKIIDIATWRAAMATIGYASNWIAAFENLNFGAPGGA